MNRTGRANFWIGLAMGAIVAAAVMFSIYYVPRKGLSFGGESIELNVVFEDAHGLHAGSPVQISGVEAGEVQSVEVRELPDLGWRVLASVEIFDGERFGPTLTTTSVFAIARSSLLGEVILAVSPGTSGERLSSGALVDGEPPIDIGTMVRDVAHVSRRLSDFMDGTNVGDPSLKQALRDLQNTLRNLSAFSEKLPD